MHNLTALSLALPGTPLHGLDDFDATAHGGLPSRPSVRTTRRTFGPRRTRRATIAGARI